MCQACVYACVYVCILYVRQRQTGRLSLVVSSLVSNSEAEILHLGQTTLYFPENVGLLKIKAYGNTP